MMEHWSFVLSKLYICPYMSLKMVTLVVVFKLASLFCKVAPIHIVAFLLSVKILVYTYFTLNLIYFCSQTIASRHIKGTLHMLHPLIFTLRRMTFSALVRLTARFVSGKLISFPQPVFPRLVLEL